MTTMVVEAVVMVLMAWARKYSANSGSSLVTPVATKTQPSFPRIDHARRDSKLEALSLLYLVPKPWRRPFSCRSIAPVAALMQGRSRGTLSLFHNTFFN